MDKNESFAALINEGYSSKGDAIILGGAILDGTPLTNALCKSAS